MVVPIEASSFLGTGVAVRLRQVSVTCWLAAFLVFKGPGLSVPLLPPRLPQDTYPPKVLSTGLGEAWEWSLNDAARTSLGGEVGTWGVLEGVSWVEVIMETEADDSTERKRRLGKHASMRPQLWTNPELHEHKQDQVLEADTITK